MAKTDTKLAPAPFTTWEESGINIELTHDGRFSWSHNERQHLHDTLAAARDAVKAMRRDELRATTLTFEPFEVLQSDGRPAMLRKLHAATLKPLIDPAPASSGEIGELFYAAPAVTELLNERAKLIRRRRQVDDALRHYAVELPHAYGKVSPAEYANKLERFIFTHNQRKAEVAKRGPAKA